jgi:Fe-S-cluster containining protein
MRHIDLPHSCEDDASDGDCIPCVAQEEVKSSCRCAECCRRLLIEVLPEDALVEPRIEKECSPIYAGPPLTETRELIGFLLNGHDGECVFLDKATNLCGIHETRPLVCRLFDCDGGDRKDLVELGILSPRD